MSKSSLVYFMLWLLLQSLVEVNCQMVFTFDPLTDSWTVPKIAGDAITKFGLTAAIDYNGKMYLWSGLIYDEYQDDMLILDTINLSWGKGTLENAPVSRDLYAATMLL